MNNENELSNSIKGMTQETASELADSINALSDRKSKSFFNSSIFELALINPSLVAPEIVKVDEVFNIEYWVTRVIIRDGIEVPEIDIDYVDEYPYPTRQSAIENGYRDFYVFAAMKGKENAINIFEGLLKK